MRALAVDTVFQMHGVAAQYVPPSGTATDCTVILAARDEDESFNGAALVAPGPHVRVRASEIAAPVEGGVFTITGGASYRVSAKPKQPDALRLVFDCPCRKV